MLLSWYDREEVDKLLFFPSRTQWSKLYIFICEERVHAYNCCRILDSQNRGKVFISVSK